MTHLKTHRPRTLHLSLKREYFEAIRDGRKSEEFRLCTPYWSKRLEGREYDRVVLTLGYPARNDHARRLVRSWRGFTVKTITHSHFGQDPVLVYAIGGPLAHASLALALACLLGIGAGNGGLLMVLAASASYNAVPAVLRYAIPEAKPAMYFGMSLGLTFAFNIMLGIPLSMGVAHQVLG